MKRLLLIAFLTVPAAADVVVIPKDNSAQRAVEEMIRRQHERDMQRRQHEYNMELERLRNRGREGIFCTHDAGGCASTAARTTSHDPDIARSYRYAAEWSGMVVVA